MTLTTGYHDFDIWVGILRDASELVSWGVPLSRYLEGVLYSLIGLSIHLLSTVAGEQNEDHENMQLSHNDGQVIYQPQLVNCRL